MDYIILELQKEPMNSNIEHSDLLKSTFRSKIKN